MKIIRLIKAIFTILTISLLVCSCSVKKVNNSDLSNIDEKIKSLLNQGKYQQAVSLMKKTGYSGQDDVKTQINMAWIYAFNKDYNKSLEIVNQITKLNPDYQEAYYLKGFIYERVDRNQDAINSYKKAIELNPKDVKSYDKIADLYQQAENYKEAINYYKQASNIDPQNYIYYLNLANIFFNQKDFEMAQNEAQKAYDYAPNSEKDNIQEILENIKLTSILKK